MRCQKGFSLVEILLVLAGVGLLVILLSAFPNSIKLVTWSRQQSLAREIAAKQIEQVREQSYINLAPGTQSFTVNLLSEGSGEKIIEDCDPTICTNSELVKKVTVLVKWNQEGILRQVKLVTFISQGGLNQ